MKMNERITDNVQVLNQFINEDILPTRPGQNIFDFTFQAKQLEKLILETQGIVERKIIKKEEDLLENQSISAKQVCDRLQLQLRTVIQARRKFVWLGGMLRHCHASDGGGEGELSAIEIVEEARRQGITVVYITQHNCIVGVQSALNYIREKEYLMQVIPAFELSAPHTKYMNEFHWKVKFPHSLMKNARQSNIQSIVEKIDTNTTQITMRVHEIISQIHNMEELENMVKGRWNKVTLLLKKRDKKGSNLSLDTIKQKYLDIILRRNRYTTSSHVPKRWMNILNVMGVWLVGRGGLTRRDMTWGLSLIETIFDNKEVERLYNERCPSGREVHFYRIDQLLPDFHDLGCDIELCHIALSELLEDEILDMIVSCGTYKDTHGILYPTISSLEYDYPGYASQHKKFTKRIIQRLNEHFQSLNQQVQSREKLIFVRATGSNADFHNSHHYSRDLRMKREDRRSYFIDADKLGSFCMKKIDEEEKLTDKLTLYKEMMSYFPFTKGRFDFIDKIYNEIIL